MLKITKITFFILTLLISTVLFAQAEIEIEPKEIDDQNTKVLTMETVTEGTVIHGVACCHFGFKKAEPYKKGLALQVHFHLPFGSEMRVWLQDKQKYGKVTCNEERVGCVSIDWVMNLKRRLNGVTLKNQCSGKPNNLLLPEGAHIGFSVLKGSVTVDGIDEPFTCKETSTISKGRTRRSD
jgi:hypothetical protein